METGIFHVETQNICSKWILIIFLTNFIVLKNKIIKSCYDILEYTYRANIFQDIDDKKEITVKIQMLSFYLGEALNKN